MEKIFQEVVKIVESHGRVKTLSPWKTMLIYCI